MAAHPVLTPALELDEPLPPRPSFRRRHDGNENMMGEGWSDFRPVAETAESRRASHRTARRAGRVAFYVFSVLLATIVGVAGSVYWQARDALGDLQAGEKKAIVAEAKKELNVAPSKDSALALKGLSPLAKESAPPPATEATTILVVGSDRRWGEKTGRSDTMMLVRVNPENKTVSILSIPRDLRVSIPGHGVNKINAAFAFGGDALLIKTLREYFGVPINHFVETNFRGFGQMVSALGGVYLPVDGRYYNRHDGTAARNFAEIDLQPGYQKLNAEQALSFVRFRHYDSDFHRAARQQLFLREAERQVKAAKYDYDKMKSLIQAFTKATASDISSLREIWRLAEAIRSTPADRISREVVPAQDATSGGVYYLDLDDPKRRAVLERWLHPEQKIRQQNMSNTVLKREPKAKPTDVSLVPDGGQGRTLISQARYQAPKCALTALPRGYHWGTSSPVRSYKLEGRPALAGWLSASSGNSVLLMQTTWLEAPILSKPTRSLSKGGRAYDVWYESGRIRQISWRMGPTVAWLTNTLLNELSNKQMLALAASCERVG